MPAKPATHTDGRLARERKTVGAMIYLYCRGHHEDAAKDRLCIECDQLLEYAMRRLDCCRFESDKPTCSQCPVHCYKKDMRERIREVMRYAGPRMMLRHPILAIRHMLDERRARRDEQNCECPAPHASKTCEHESTCSHEHEEQ